MRSLRTMSTAAALLAMTATPALAATANPAQSLSVAAAPRAATPTTRANQLEGRGAIIAAVLAAGVVIGGILLIADSDDDPDSN